MSAQRRTRSHASRVRRRSVGRASSLVLALAWLPLAGGCGEEPLRASFTSRVVQRDSCRVVGDRPEVCTRDEAFTDVRLRIVERDDGLVWLYGLPRGGVSDRAILGTRDTSGGFLFVDEMSQENNASGCSLRSRLEIAVAIDPEADAGRVGQDACIALLGRETEVVASSAGCDNVNVPPLPSTLILRRRWEAPLACAPERAPGI